MGKNPGAVNKTSLESMYVTPDISGVKNKIFCAAAQPFGAEIKILDAAAQRHSDAAAGVAKGCGAP